jgi:polyisoprenoid-binding protein YceI
MKRTSLLLGIALIAFVVLSQTGAEAKVRTFADRFAGAAADGPTGVYNFDKAHSFIGFKIKHNGLIEVPGFFRDFTGTVNYDAKDVSKSTVEFTAKVTSVDTGVKARDDHLRTKDFFEVETYPDITFKSTKVEKKGNTWMLTGDFTMKGVTKSITFPFNITGWLPATERSGGRMGITAETKINRRDYGINYGNTAPGAIVAVADDVAIVLQIEAPMRREAPTAPAATPKPE